MGGDGDEGGTGAVATDEVDSGLQREELADQTRVLFSQRDLSPSNNNNINNNIGVKRRTSNQR